MKTYFHSTGLNTGRRRMAWGAAVLSAMVLAGCSGNASLDTPVAAEPARPVKAMVIGSTAAEESRTFPGIVKAARESELAFRVGGPLVAFDVRIGQQVSRGAVIARIDPRDFDVNVMRVSAALEQARANLKAMKSGARAEDIALLEAQQKAAAARMADALKDFERQKNLLAEHATSTAQFDKTKTALDVARSGLDVVTQQLHKARKGARAEEIEAAEAHIKALGADLEVARNALADTVLQAPFDGYIHRKYLEVHENVTPGRPVASLLDYSMVEVKTGVPEDIVVRQAAIADVFCTLESYPGQRIQATVKEIGRKTDAANQSYPMSVVLQMPETLSAESGMAATVHLLLKSGTPDDTGIFLPVAAIFSDGDGKSCVWRIDPQQMITVRTPVDTGALVGDTIRINSGLRPGETVAVAGARFLREGQRVRVLNDGPKEQL